jgi:hypothetical protein
MEDAAFFSHPPKPALGMHFGGFTLAKCECPHGRRAPTQLGLNWADVSGRNWPSADARSRNAVRHDCAPHQAVDDPTRSFRLALVAPFFVRLSGGVVHRSLALE